MISDPRSRKELMKESEDRLEFVIALAVFFPTLLYSLSKLASQNDQQANSMVVSWSIIVAAYLIDYCIFQYFKKIAKSIIIKFVTFLPLLGVVSFIVPIWYMALYKNAPISGFNAFLFRVFVFGLPVVPLLLLIALLTEVIIHQYTKK
jgi:hypothetical protein